MRRSFKFRMRPTAGQHLRLGACLETHRELYNAALEERRGAWRRCHKGISYREQSAQLKEIRAVRSDVAVWSFSCGHRTQADEHAARNILRVGLARLAAEQAEAA